MQYAKLIDGQLHFSPNPILVDSNYIGNPNGDLCLALGFQPVRYTEMPEPQGIGWYSTIWVESEEGIVQTWEWHEASGNDEISDSEALSILLGGGSNAAR